MTDQELINALARLGYKSEQTEDGLVRIIVDPSDFIRGAPKLHKDLKAVGWKRSFSYRASRPLTKEEIEMWDKFLHPLDYLEPLAYPKMPKVKKPKRTEAKEETYIQLSLF